MKPDGTGASMARDSLLSIFGAFLKLGATSFGGPIAHLGYLRTEFVDRRKWLDEKAYADLVALCQFLPGPASSQVGMALGISRRGIPGGFAAWLGFTLPSAILMIAFAYGLRLLPGSGDSGWLHGLKLAAVAIVAQAVWGLGKQLCPDRTRASFAVGAALFVLLWPGAPVQIAAIAVGALLGWRLLARSDAPVHEPVFGGSRRLSWIAGTLFVGLLVVLPVAAHGTGNYALSLFDSFYRAGSLVFGGGHVVLPLLREEVVPHGWISDSDFLAGYGMAQVLPGPLFTFAAYVGAAAGGQPNGWIGGTIALVAIFLPAFLLVLAALPYWDQWRRRPAIRAAMDGVNAVVVGILLAALYDPIFSSSVRGPRDFAVALTAFALLVFWRLSPLWVVAFSAAAGMALAAAPA
jgi:chromate transporter